MEALARATIEQIHAKGYYDGISGSTVLYGIAIRGKHPTVLSEHLELF